MKRFFTALLPLFICTALYSQEYMAFPTDNARWRIYDWAYGGNVASSWRYIDYILEGDTLIQDTSYKKLSAYTVKGEEYNSNSYVLSQTASLKGFLRESDKRIYFKDFVTGNIELLYDFNNRNIGDTLHIGKFNIDGKVYFIINAVDSVLIDGKYRKRYGFKVVRSDNGTPFWDAGYKLVEGIGALTGLFDAYRLEGETRFELLCFAHKGNVLYNRLRLQGSSEYPCDYTLEQLRIGVERAENKARILSVYPNPASNNVYILVNAVNTNADFTIDIIGKEGSVLTSTSVLANNNTNDIPINISHLQNGYYTLRIQSENTVSQHKLIVIH